MQRKREIFCPLFDSKRATTVRAELVRQNTESRSFIWSHTKVAGVLAFVFPYVNVANKTNTLEKWKRQAEGQKFIQTVSVTTERPMKCASTCILFVEEDPTQHSLTISRGKDETFPFAIITSCVL